MLKIIAFTSSFLAIILFIIDAHNSFGSLINVKEFLNYLQPYLPPKILRIENSALAQMPLSPFLGAISLICYLWRYYKHKKYLGIEFY